MTRSSLLPILILACSSATPPERYGFVTVLGNDTVAVERIERSPDRLVADGVDRWPFVRRRHTEFQLPNSLGRSRHGAPTRTIQRTASTKSRLSAPERPASPTFPGRSGASRSH